MTNFVHGAYYPSWKIYRGKAPSSMNVSVLTHVFYAFVRLQDDGAVCVGHPHPKCPSQYHSRAASIWTRKPTHNCLSMGHMAV